MEKEKDTLLAQLANLTLKMDIPHFRKQDVKWLLKNLSVRNKQHENFNKAMEIIIQLNKMGVFR